MGRLFMFGKRKKADSTPQAVERAHFFAEPIEVPIFGGEQCLGFALHGTPEVSEG
jgi:hypothetical protein